MSVRLTSTALPHLGLKNGEKAQMKSMTVIFSVEGKKSFQQDAQTLHYVRYCISLCMCYCRASSIFVVSPSGLRMPSYLYF